MTNPIPFQTQLLKAIFGGDSVVDVSEYQQLFTQYKQFSSHNANAVRAWAESQGPLVQSLVTDFDSPPSVSSFSGRTFETEKSERPTFIQTADAWNDVPIRIAGGFGGESREVGTRDARILRAFVTYQRTHPEFVLDLRTNPKNETKTKAGLVQVAELEHMGRSLAFDSATQKYCFSDAAHLVNNMIFNHEKYSFSILSTETFDICIATATMLGRLAAQAPSTTDKPMTYSDILNTYPEIREALATLGKYLDAAKDERKTLMGSVLAEIAFEKAYELGPYQEKSKPNIPTLPLDGCWPILETEEDKGSSQ